MAAVDYHAVLKSVNNVLKNLPPGESFSNKYEKLDLNLSNLYGWSRWPRKWRKLNPTEIILPFIMPRELTFKNSVVSGSTAFDQYSPGPKGRG